MRPSGRVIGRILSLGFPLPGPSADNYTFASAPAFFDYDALVVDPAALGQLLDGVIEGTAEAHTFGGHRVVVTPEAPGDVALADLLAQRREETRRALQRGATIVVFARPPAARTIAGAGARDEYCWLPEEASAFRSSMLVRGDGTRAQVVDDAHPLAAFLAGQLANIAYRAHLAEGEAEIRVFARSHGGAAIGAELPALNGKLIVLPALARMPSGEARYAMSDALQAGIRRALGVKAEGRPPGWLSAHPVPGLVERDAALAAAGRALDGAQDEASAAAAARDALARWQDLLWQEGALGLEPVIVDALRLVGFDVYDQKADALELRGEGVPVLVEVEASEHPVGMAPHYRLRARIERAIVARGSAPRGLLIVNGCRLQAPSQRTKQASDELVLAAQTMRYGIGTTAGLFAAAMAKLSGDDDAVAAYRRRIVTEDGLLA